MNQTERIMIACDPWGIWDTNTDAWVHTETGTEDAANNGAARANATLNPWSCSTRYEARRYVPKSAFP